MRALLILVVMAAATPARADAPTKTERFTLSIMAADAVALGLVGLGVVSFAAGTEADTSSEGDPKIARGIGLALAGFFVFAIAPCVIHERKDSGNSELSLALRVGVPVATGLIGVAAEAPAIPVLGVVAVMVADWVFLAKREVPVTPVAAPAPGGGAIVGLAGAF